MNALLYKLRDFEKKDIQSVASLHKRAWQVAFRGILSDSLLDNLSDGEFLSVWEKINEIKSRQNLVATLNEVPIGFVSLGPSQESKAIAEIYGIYVDPDHFGRGVGRLLIHGALEVLTAQDYSKVLLWVMTKNHSAKQFYEKIGFSDSMITRLSSRKNESFEENRYWLDLSSIN